MKVQWFARVQGPHHGRDAARPTAMFLVPVVWITETQPGTTAIHHGVVKLLQLSGGHPAKVCLAFESRFRDEDGINDFVASLGKPPNL